MSAPSLCIVACVVSLAWRPLLAVETGDIDGDGVLSIADAWQFMRNAPVLEEDVAAFEAHACSPRWSGGEFTPGWYLAGLVYLESLRRATPGALPHWDQIWGNIETPGADRVEDDRVSVRVMDVTVPGGTDNNVLVRLLISSEVLVKAFSLVIDSHGSLRVPFSGGRFRPAEDWRFTFASVRTDDPFNESDAAYTAASDLKVNVRFGPYLITGGQYVITYGLDLRPDEALLPGEYTVETIARLPKALQPGEYPLVLGRGSEVLVDEGEVIRPKENRIGALKVVEEVRVGWDGGVPPLNVNAHERRIEGKVRFRVTSSTGGPGDIIPITLQIYSEVPLNTLYVHVGWSSDQGVLECIDDPVSVFIDPDTGAPYPAVNFRGRVHQDCADSPSVGLPYFSANFGFLGGGAWMSDNPDLSDTTYPERVLDYFRPLNEWVNIVEARVKIAECARPGDEIRFSVVPFDPTDYYRIIPYPCFRPYDVDYPCDRELNPGEMYWKYDYELEDGTVTVTGPQGPKCPNSALSARFVLGSGEGAPGEFVEVPIYASTSESVSRLRIVLDSMPELAWVEAINVNVVRDADGLSDVQTAERGQTVFTSQCAGQGKDQVCTYAVPGPTNFFESDRQHAIIDQYVSPFDRIVNDYPGTELRQLGSLVVRISDSLKVGPAGVVIALQGAQVNYRGAGIESGAFGQVPDVSHFYRAEVIAGAVYVRGSGFLRGDLDANGRAQVTDAVNLLNYLFLNGFKPSCEDAADVDDDGRIMLTDGIFLLNVLFLNGVPVDPCVQCGSDDSMDSLSCTSSSCG